MSEATNSTPGPAPVTPEGEERARVTAAQLGRLVHFLVGEHWVAVTVEARGIEVVLRMAPHAAEQLIEHCDAVRQLGGLGAAPGITVLPGGDRLLDQLAPHVFTGGAWQ